MLIKFFYFQDKSQALSKSQIETFLIGNGLSERVVALLLSFIEVEVTFEKFFNFLRPIMKKDNIMRSLCKEGLHNLELVISNAITLGVKVRIFLFLATLTL